jgi:hypothetical protein
VCVCVCVCVRECPCLFGMQPTPTHLLWKKRSEELLSDMIYPVTNDVHGLIQSSRVTLRYVLCDAMRSWETIKLLRRNVSTSADKDIWLITHIVHAQQLAPPLYVTTNFNNILWYF